MNREVLTTHLALMQRIGFDIVHVTRGERQGGLARNELAARWRACSDEDLRTQTGFVIARRR